MFAPWCPPETFGAQLELQLYKQRCPRSRLSLPHSGDTERLTGEASVTLLAGARVEKSPYLYTGIISGKYVRLFSVSFIFLAEGGRAYQVEVCWPVRLQFLEDL
jgi:hypothetical protein